MLSAGYCYQTARVTKWS